MRKNAFVLLYLALGLGAAVAHAESTDLLGSADTGTFKAKKHTLLYALVEPKALRGESGAPADAKKKPVASKKPAAGGKRYPLVVFLHGAGGMGSERKTGRMGDGAGQFVETMTEDCYFFMPQASQIWSGVPWAPAPYSMKENDPDVLNNAVIECIEWLIENNAVDKDRVYIAGTSMGSMGMWDLACRKPELFAAGISCCGGFDASKAKKISKIKFRIFHGDADNIVPEAGSQAMYAALKEAGADVAYHVYPGGNHFIWEQTYRNKENIDWLFKQRRGAAKKDGSKSKAGEVAMAEDREIRTWTATKGATMEARLLETRGGKAVLAGADGVRKSIVIKQLSTEDQDY
ncbi:MAG: prolyl oligopeptidase family serine peptidase, partial [bacterium]